MVLFVGYHEAEQRMLRNILSGLEKANIRCNHFQECEIFSNCEDYEEPILLPIFDSFIPGIRNSYRNKFALYSPQVLKEIETKLLDLSPLLVVWSPGSEYGLIVRERARTNGIKTICIIPPYFEFKCIEPLRIPVYHKDEIFIVSGIAGRTRLRQAGVSDNAIYEVGCPFLDDFFARELTSVANSINILFPLQNMQEDFQLYENLSEYCQIKDHSILNIRQHPSGISNEINPLSITEKSFLKFSTNIALEKDIEQSWVVVGNTSFVLFECIALGRPMVSWNSSYLPSNIYKPEAYAFNFTQTKKELFSRLDFIYEKRKEVTPKHIRSMATGILSKSIKSSSFTRSSTDEVISIILKTL